MSTRVPYYLTTESIRGAFRGASLEILMFHRYRELVERLRTIEESIGEKGSSFYKRLSWLIERGEDRKSKMFCPICEENEVKHFAVFYLYDSESYKEITTFTATKEHSCCDEEDCKNHLKYCGLGGEVDLKPIKFSVIPELAKNDYEEKMLLDLFREFFDLKGFLRGQEALKFFEE